MQLVCWSGLPFFMYMLTSFFYNRFILFVCVEVLWPSQSNGVMLSMVSLPTVLSTSLGKRVFAWRFILNENILF